LRSRQAKTITFVSDIDSLSFQVAPGQDQDFLIQLADGRQAKTRIATLRQPLRWIDSSPASTPLVIPFTIGQDNKIHVKGRINDSAPLDFMFDTGADNVVIYKSGMEKNPGLAFDGTILNQGAGGSATRRTSNDNRIEVSGIGWDHELVMQIEKQADAADGILGANLFEDKVIELDFDELLMRVHESMPKLAPGWAAFPIKYEGSTPFIQVALGLGKDRFTDWYCYDTGASGSVHCNQEFCEAHALIYSLPELSRVRVGGVGARTKRCPVVLLPELFLGEFKLDQLPIVIEENDGQPSVAGRLLGMDVLKRFNAIIDYQSSVIYLKPNSLRNMPYRLSSDTGWIILAASTAGMVAVVFGGLVLYRRRRRTSK
jgi:hypothetical protein